MNSINWINDGSATKQGEQMGEQNWIYQFILYFLKGFRVVFQWTPAPPDARARQYAEPFFLAFGTEALFKGEEGIQAIGEQMRVDGKR